MDKLLGRFYGMPSAEYHRYPAYSKTALDWVNRSMAHYLEWRANPPEPTPALIVGAAFHCRVLEPARYQEDYPVAPEVDRRTKAGKEAYALFELDNGGKTVLTAVQAEQIEAMAKSVFDHPIAPKLLVDGDAEQSFFWIDKRTGIHCKCRPDFLRHDKIIVDLKTTDDASYDAFVRKICSYRYHAQGALYLDGVSEVLGERHETFLFIVVEKDAPYAVAIYRLDTDPIKVGRIAYENNLDRIKKYESDPTLWAGYDLHIHDILLPPWAA